MASSSSSSADATPLLGRRVTVVGTSRAELNGTSGKALDFDGDKGRYNVQLDNGQVVALKPVNLEAIAEAGPLGAASGGGASSRSPAPAPRSSAKAAGGTGDGAGSSGPLGVPWPTWGLIVMAIAWVYQFLQGSSGGAGAGGGAGGLWGADTGEDVDFDDGDDGFLSGAVREVATLDQLRGALAHHSDSTGLPVVVDFFSHSCGPCRMIAPAFKRLAKEMKGQAVFLKVDVNRNYEAASVCNVRGMPTFQFYLHKKKVHEFSGADESGLKHYVQSAVRMAEKDGTFTGMEVTAQALRDFYTAHDPSKVGDAESLAAKYVKKTALIMRVSKHKYGQAPTASLRKAPDDDGGVVKEHGGAGASGRGRPMAERSSEDLRAELAGLQAELERRGAAVDGAAGGAADDDEDDELPFLPLEQATAAAGGGGGAGAHQVAIVGGGPAGLAAAIYAARAGLRPLVVAPAFGGQLLGKGVDVENFPAVVGEQATGRGLVELMRRQALSFEARFVNTAVLGVDLKSRPFRLTVNGTDRPLVAEAVIFASGAESRWLGVQGEHEFRGRGVSACATCDGFLFRGKDVVVVGGGDHAMEDALYLARSSRSVTVVHRRNAFRASRILAERVLNHSSIKVRWDTEVSSFVGQEDLSQVILHSKDGEERLDAAGAFVAIGHTPGTAFLKGQLDLDEDGYIALKRGMATSVPGVFAAGDVADRTYRQAITASGSGAMAALDVERFLATDGGAGR